MSSAAPRSRWRRGMLLAGRYRVRRVRQGGMGEVLLCIDEREGAAVALKFRGPEEPWLTAHRAERHRLRFELEGAVWAGLGAHPNIVQCHYVTVIDGSPALCLEWVADPARPETSLHHTITKAGGVRPIDAFRIAAEICDALAHAATVYPGFVHRDLKVENVLIARDGTAKVTDFGFAQFDSALADDRLATVFQQTVGTPTTMAPEQWLDGVVDARADVYAVGCVLFRMLTNRRPFEGKEREDFRRAHRHGPTPTLGEAFPAEVRGLVERCLARSPEGRPASPRVLAEELRSIALAVYGVSLPPPASARDLAPAEVVNRAVSRFNLGKVDDALRDLDAAGSATPAALLARALVHQSLGHATDALAAFDAAINRDPGFGRAHYNRANLLRDLGRAAEAEAGYERAIACDPSLAQAWNNLGLLRTAAGDLPGAEAALTQAIETGGLREARANRGMLRLRLGDAPGAVADLAALATASAATPEQLAALGRARRATGDLRGAVESLSGAIDTPGAPVEWRIERAEALAAAGHRSGAFDELGAIIRSVPSDPRALRVRARLYHDDGLLEPALADLARAIELEPDDPSAYYEMGLLLGEDGQFQLALAFIDEAARGGHAPAQAALARFVHPPRGGPRSLLTPGGIAR